MEVILKDFCEKLFAEVKHGDQENQDWLEKKIQSFLEVYLSENPEETPQRVEVYYRISGDYCAFHEISGCVVYDVTNDISLGDESLEDCQNFEREDYCDMQIVSALLYKGGYYIDPGL